MSAIRRLSVLVALSALVGCGGARSTYTPKAEGTGALSWGYAEQRLEVYKGGERVGRVGDWADLDVAVGCVPEAGRLAAEAESEGTLGVIFSYAAVGTLVGSSAYGVAGVLDDDSGNDVDALVVMGSGLVVGLGLALVGIDQQGASLRDAVDSVNIYTDRYASTPACLRRGALE